MMKKQCILFILLATLVSRAEINPCSRIIDVGTTKAVPFEDAVSPDGEYAVGWTAFSKRKDAAPIDWSKWNAGNIEDFFTTDGSIEIDGDFYGMTDGVIDLKNKAFLALPSEYPEWPHKNRGYLFAVWGPARNGVRHALVENDSRFYTENLWLITIDSHGMHAVDLATKLTQAIEPILQARRPIGARDYATFLHDFDPGNATISINGDTVSLPFYSDIPKSMLETSAVKGTITFHLSDSGVVKVASDTPVDDPFAENPQLKQADRNLNQVYEKLAKSLNASDREALKKEQLAWIHDIRDPMAEQAMEVVNSADPPLTPQENRSKVLLAETQKRLTELQGRLK